MSRLTKLDKPSDIFADIASRAGKPLTNSISDEPSIKSFNKEVSNNLKNGPGIMMKIASKWADQQASNIDEESDNSDIDNPGEEIDAPKDVFDSEQSNLLQEMERFEKENRLLKLTQGSTSDSVMTTTKVVEKKVLVIVCVKRYFFKVENNCLGLKDIYLTLTNISPGFSKK